jgi:hypothetical protein
MTAAKGQGGTPATGSRPPARTPPLRSIFIQDRWGFGGTRAGPDPESRPSSAGVPDPYRKRATLGGVRMATREPVEAVPRRGSRARGQPALVPREDARVGGVRAGAARPVAAPRPTPTVGLVTWR